MLVILRNSLRGVDFHQFDPSRLELRRLLTRLRRELRSNELVMIAFAIVLGSASSLLTALQESLTRALQSLFFALPAGVQLDQLERLNTSQLLMLPMGGVLLVAFTKLCLVRKRPLIDAVEANALYGGRMEIGDSLIVSGQTLISSGLGASVGLEAAYAQMGAAAASRAGQWAGLRRSDLRIMVGAGAGAAISAAFSAPLAGAFYAFEIVIGAYTPSAIAPVAAATLTACLVGQGLGLRSHFTVHSAPGVIAPYHYVLFALLAALCGVVAIVLMRAVATVDRAAVRLRIPSWARPILGGLLLIPLAMISPHVLSSGHGVLSIAATGTLATIALIFITKCVASIVSLGSGFRGGLFFASLVLGSLLGRIFNDLLTMAAAGPLLDASDAMLVGMAALAVAVVGGPMSMAMLVLETTHDLSVTGAVLAASLVSSTIVRVGFGYSFSTWRLHLRGETIKSARDVGWIRSLTAERMMQPQPSVASETTIVSEFRQRFPLGSTNQVVLVAEDGRYRGLATPVAAHDEALDQDAPISSCATYPGEALTPAMDIHAVMQVFDRLGADELAVVDHERHVLGILSEAFVRRRYASEIEKAQREFFGES